MTAFSRNPTRQRSLFTLLALGLGASAAHAASLSAFAGVVGGAGSGSIAGGCTTYGPPSDLSFFGGFAAGLQVLGGNASCGYSGGWSTNSSSGSTTPVTNSRSLGPTVLGNPGYAESFDGTAKSRASYGSLGASAHGHLDATPPSYTAGTTVDDAVGAAQFSDTLTATVPKSYTTLSTAGYVTYSFLLEGTMSAPGTPEAFVNGEVVTAFNVQQDGGSIDTIMDAETRTGNTGYFYGAPTTGGGWTISPGLVTGGSVITTRRYAIDLSKSWDVEAGLIVDVYGNADNSFYDSARLVGIGLFDSNGNAISGFSLASASGVNYLAAVPEPASLWLAALGLAAGVGRARTSARRTKAMPRSDGVS